MYIIKVGPDAYIYNVVGEYCNITNKGKIPKFINSDDDILIFDIFESDIIDNIKKSIKEIIDSKEKK